MRRMAGIVAAVAVGFIAGCSGEASGNRDMTASAGAVIAENIEEKPEEKKTEMGDEKGAEGERTEILVAAAASLKNVYEEELIPMFQEQYPGVSVRGTYDSSGKLQVQMEEGLEADVFMSAAQKQMEALEAEGRILPETRVDLLENQIVLIVPKGNDTGLESFADIRRAGSIALGDPASVPAGQYAQEALTRLGVWEEIQERVSLGSHVTEVLHQVAAGSADAGIVYATDAAGMAGKVEVIAAAPEGSLETRVLYLVAVVQGSAHPETAERFVEFLQTREAMAVFERYGFSAGEEVGE